MDQLEIRKGCLVETHKNQYISLICQDKNCQEISRTLCQQCLLYKSLYHSNCKTYIGFKGRTYNELEYLHTEENEVKTLTEEIFQNEQEAEEKIDNYFEELLYSIAEKINQLKKEAKIKQIEKIRANKQEFKNYLKKQEEMKDNLKKLEKDLENFQQQHINIEEFNQLLQQNQDKSMSIEEQQKYVKNITEEAMNHPFQNTFNSEQLDKMKTKFSDLLDYEFKTSLNQIKIEQMEPWKGCEQNIEITENTYKKIFEHYFILRSQRSFKRQDKIHFKFQISNIDYDNFYIGITSVDDIFDIYDQYFHTGNQVDLNSYNNSKQPIQNKGEKLNEEVFKDGQVYEMEVCVQDNLMRIQDQEGKCVIENVYEFEENVEEWIIVINERDYHPIGFTIQVL